MARITINLLSTCNRKFSVKIVKVKDDNYVVRQDRFSRDYRHDLLLEPTDREGEYFASYVAEELPAGAYYISLNLANGAKIESVKKHRGSICKKFVIENDKVLVSLDTHGDITLDYKTYAEKYEYNERMHQHAAAYDQKQDLIKVVYTMPAADAKAGKRFVCDLIDDYAKSVGLSFNEFAQYALCKSLTKDTRRKFTPAKEPAKKR